MFIIPFKEPAAWTSQMTLTMVNFFLYFRWNAINQYWVMNIYNANNVPILLGIKVVTNWNLTGPFTVIGQPAGDIVCQDIVGNWLDITRFSMGQDQELIYYEPGQLKADA